MDEINWDDSGWDSNALAELNQYNQGSEEVQPWQNLDNSGTANISDVTDPIYSDYGDPSSGPGGAGTSYTGGDYPGNDDSGSFSGSFNASDLAKFFANNPALAGIAKVLGSVGAGKLADKLFDVQGGPGGYKGGIPTLTASRQMLPIPTTMQDASGRTVARRPGSGGVTYFSPMQYLKPGEAPTAVQQPAQSTPTGIANLPAINRAPIQQPQQSPAQRVAENDPFYQSPEFKAYQNDPSNAYGTMDMYDSPYFGRVGSGSAGRAMDRAYEQYKGIAPRQNQMSPMPFDLSAPTYDFAAGGIANLGGYSDGGRLLRGPGDGVSDSIPAMIGKKQPARLADGEFVVPARIVSELGNGSTEAGARKLYAMMDRIKKARRKAKNIAADTKSDKHLPA
jgi:hypothetical protein